MLTPLLLGGGLVMKHETNIMVWFTEVLKMDDGSNISSMSLSQVVFLVFAHLTYSPTGGASPLTFGDVRAQLGLI